VARLEQTQVDAALLEWWDERDGFCWQPWRTEPLVLIVPPADRLGGVRSISRAELARLPLIGGEPGTGTGRLLRAYFAGAPMPEISMSLGSTEAVKRAVEAGLGASLVLACAVVDELRQGRLRAIPLADEMPQKTLHLVWRNDLGNGHPLVQFLASVGHTAPGAGSALVAG